MIKFDLFKFFLCALTESRSVKQTSPHSKSPKQSGFTLIEIITTIATISITLGIGAPALTDYFAIQDVKTSRDTFVSFIRTAQKHAIVQKKTIVICSSKNGETCTGASPSTANDWIPGDGFIGFEDIDSSSNDNGNGKGNSNKNSNENTQYTRQQSTDPLLFSSETGLPSEIIITKNNNSGDGFIVFSSSGLMEDMTIDFCNNKPTLPDERIHVSRFGNVTYKSSSVTHCI